MGSQRSLLLPNTSFKLLSFTFIQKLSEINIQDELTFFMYSHFVRYLSFIFKVGSILFPTRKDTNCNKFGKLGSRSVILIEWFHHFWLLLLIADLKIINAHVHHLILKIHHKFLRNSLISLINLVKLLLTKIILNIFLLFMRHFIWRNEILHLILLLNWIKWLKLHILRHHSLIKNKWVLGHIIKRLMHSKVRLSHKLLWVVLLVTVTHLKIHLVHLLMIYVLMLKIIHGHCILFKWRVLYILILNLITGRWKLLFLIIWMELLGLLTVLIIIVLLIHFLITFTLYSNFTEREYRYTGCNNIKSIRVLKWFIKW